MNNITISKAVIAQYLPANPIIVEAGAHLGRDTIKMIQQWPQATIHAFEPVPHLFEQLCAKTTEYPTITCYPEALGNSSGTTTLYVSSGRSTATSSLLIPYLYAQEHPDTFFHPLSIPVITLDAWAQQNNISHIDFMWLDMQGSELAALQAGITVLVSVRVIHIEATHTERYKNNPLYPEVRNFLEQQGFCVIDEAFNDHGWGNVLFARSSLS